MPIISSFYGIIIQMYFKDEKKHHLPHFHAEYAEYSAVFDFKGNLIDGTLPKKKINLIVAWAEIHEEELEAAWKAIKMGEIIKIEGLK